MICTEEATDVEVLEAIRQRREVTQFLDARVEPAVLRAVVEAGYRAPTGNHLISRELIVIQDRGILTRLTQTTPYMPWLAGAAAGIVVTGRPDVSKYWVQDGSIACAFMWLAAVEQGLGMAFGAVYHAQDAEESARREGYAREVLHLPDDRRVLAILGVGRPAAWPEGKPPHAKEQVIFLNRFGQSWQE